MATSPQQREAEVYSDIVCSIVQSMKNGDPTEEIRDMLIETATFRNTLKEWKDDRHQLNALQCSIIHRHPGAVKLLNSWDFSYKTITKGIKAEENEPQSSGTLNDFYQSYKEKQHRVQKVSTNTNVIVNLNGESVPEKQSNFRKAVLGPGGMKINSPVHLACAVGDLDILKILVPKDDPIESQILLQEKSIITYNLAQRNCVFHTSTYKEKESCAIYDGRCNGMVVAPVNKKAYTDVNKNENICRNPFEQSNVEAMDADFRDRDIRGLQESDENVAENESNREHNQQRGMEEESAQRITETETQCNCISTNENINGVDMPKTPFEVCIDGNHLQCASYLARILYDLKRPTAFVKRNRQPPVMKRNCQPFMVQEIPAQQRDSLNHSHLYFGESTVKSNNSTGPVPEKSLLHIACFLGNAAYLDLLLRNGFRSVINERDDTSMPPLFEAISCSVECVRLLLRFGAEVNATVACQNALHKLYDESIEETSFMTECTKALISAGINVNAQDSNNNTPLDYLASDFSKETLHMTQHGRFVSLAERNQHARKCMEILLEAGAKTQVPTSRGRDVDHTIGHTLLLNSSWPVSSFFSKNPKLVYLILELFFKHGQDPNMLPVNNESSLFSKLISVIGHCLSAFEDDLQTKFVHLFAINGADLNHPIPPPKRALDSGPIRIWNVYPLIMALQEKLPTAVLELMANFMSLSVLSDCVVAMAEGQTWLRFEMMRGNGVPPGIQGATNPYRNYKTQWESLAQKLQTSVRSLRHCTKLIILNSLQGKGSRVSNLPIPKAMQLYLCSDTF